MFGQNFFCCCGGSLAQLIPREAFVRKLSFHRIHQSPFWPNQQIEIRGKFQKVGTNIRPISPEKCASPEKWLPPHMSSFLLPQSQDDRELEETKCRARADTPQFFRSFINFTHLNLIWYRQGWNVKSMHFQINRSSSSPGRAHRSHRLQHHQQVKVLEVWWKERQVMSSWGSREVILCSLQPDLNVSCGKCAQDVFVMRGEG